MKRLLLLLFIIEVVAWSWLKHAMSAWMILWLSLIAIFVGYRLIQHSLVTLIPQLNQLQTNQVALPQSTEKVVIKSLCGVIAGALFIFPGIVSDALALILLLPPVQLLLGRRVMSMLLARRDMLFGSATFGRDSANPLGGFGRVFSTTQQSTISRTAKPSPRPHQGTTIEGESREIT